jgi:hypothetical protein
MKPVSGAGLLPGQPHGHATNTSAPSHPRTSRNANPFESMRSAGLGALVAAGLAFSSTTRLRAQTPTSQPGASATVKDAPLSADFQTEVLLRLTPPPDEVAAYAVRLQGALDAAGVAPGPLQFIALVDRNPNVQALLLYWG